jgi:hypothetical protein
LPAAVLTGVAAALAVPGARRARLIRALVLAATTALPLIPWAWRNALVLGEPVATTTHGGYTLALANNPVYYAEILDGPPGAVWSGPNQFRWFESVNRRTAGMTEPQADRALFGDALRLIRDRPRDFARASLARLGRFWSVAPSASVYPGWLRAASALWTIPLWIALAAGLIRRDLWRWPRIAAPMILIALSMVHTIYWTDARMRAPIVPAIALIAAPGAAILARRIGLDRTLLFGG